MKEIDHKRMKDMEHDEKIQRRIKEIEQDIISKQHEINFLEYKANKLKKTYTSECVELFSLSREIFQGKPYGSLDQWLQLRVEEQEKWEKMAIRFKKFMVKHIQNDSDHLVDYLKELYNNKFGIDQTDSFWKGLIYLILKDISYDRHDIG